MHQPQDYATSYREYLLLGERFQGAKQNYNTCDKYLEWKISQDNCVRLKFYEQASVVEFLIFEFEWEISFKLQFTLF